MLRIAYTMARYPKTALREKVESNCEVTPMPGRIARVTSRFCLARESGEKLRSHTHAGQNGDETLGMAKEPEQMLPEQRRSAFVIQNLVADQQAARHEEAGSG